MEKALVDLHKKVLEAAHTRKVYLHILQRTKVGRKDYIT